MHIPLIEMKSFSDNWRVFQEFRKLRVVFAKVLHGYSWVFRDFALIEDQDCEGACLLLGSGSEIQSQLPF